MISGIVERRRDRRGPPPSVNEAMGESGRDDLRDRLDAGGPAARLGQGDGARPLGREFEPPGPQRVASPDDPRRAGVDQGARAEADEVRAGQRRDRPPAAVGDVELDRDPLAVAPGGDDRREVVRRRLARQQRPRAPVEGVGADLLIRRADHPRRVVAVGVRLDRGGDRDAGSPVPVADREVVGPAVADPREGQPEAGPESTPRCSASSNWNPGCGIARRASRVTPSSSRPAPASSGGTTR